MTDPASAKICTLCGAGCAGQARTKDAHGNYYHQHCYEEAKRRRSGQPSVAGPAPADDDAISLLGDLIDEAPAAAPVAAVPMAHAGPAAQAASPTRRKAPRAGAGDLWPLLIGSLSTIGGAIGTVFFGLAVIRVIGLAPWELSTLYAVVAVLSSLFPFLLSLWLALAGIGVMRRSPTAPSFIRRWAIWMIIVMTLLCGLALLMRAGAMSNPRSIEDPDLTRTIDVFITAFLVGAAVLLLWPIFILAWFAQGTIREQTDRW